MGDVLWLHLIPGSDVADLMETVDEIMRLPSILDAFDGLAHSGRPPTKATGLTPAEFNFFATPAEPGACPVCLEKGADTRLVACPLAHVFHRECLRKWVSNHPTCPLCRRAARLDDAPAAAPDTT
jgi:hypothetical protein